ncbi:hypothetical protein OZD70_05780 [Wolbachia endosymbiont of Drosophila tsacasi]|nr:hypothetical protein [Wolbachia pipientis]MDE5062731.1 hypothetical protein [Wolbachia endosymbiont of Drosophila tsacasi]
MKITEYLQFHNKGAGEACQVSFFVSMLSATWMTPSAVRIAF